MVVHMDLVTEVPEVPVTEVPIDHMDPDPVMEVLVDPIMVEDEITIVKDPELMEEMPTNHEAIHTTNHMEPVPAHHVPQNLEDIKFKTHTFLFINS